MEQHSIKVIARIRSDFKTKFGVPRQSGLVEALRARIVFEPEYRNADALRGIEGFSHLWLIWQFSEAVREDWSPTVRPPRLGGNERMGVFATRSPFRPNAIGLSCVRLEGVEQTAEGSVLLVSGADLMDGTPIYDIKPYAAYSDAHPEARSGFARPEMKFLEVVFPEELLRKVSEEKRQPLIGVLEQDPRAAYEKKPGYVYGMKFASYDVRFQVRGDVLQVVDVVCSEEQHIK